VTAPPNDREFPPGDLRRIVLHWTAGDYRTVYPSYHFCIALDSSDRPIAVATHDLRANMRDVSARSEPYAAHTSGRNSYAIGLAICGMRDATPHDFGRFPIRADMLALFCATAARLADAYEIPIDAEHIATHAEHAVTDGYFGSGEDERWDVARLSPSSKSLEPDDARRAGDALRAMIGACQRGY
jgi:hypothetical protein